MFRELICYKFPHQQIMLFSDSYLTFFIIIDIMKGKIGK